MERECVYMGIHVHVHIMCKYVCVCVCVLLQCCTFALLLYTVATASDGGPRLSMIQTFQTIWWKEGLRGLYRGLVPNFLKVAPAVSVAYVMYEQIKRVLGVPTVK